MKTESAVETKSSHILLSHLPPVPSSILVLGCNAKFKTGDLTSLGYQITLGGIRKSWDGDINSKRNGVQTLDLDCFFDSDDPKLSAKPYDVVVFEDSSPVHLSLSGFLKPVRSLLKSNGALLIYAEIPDKPVYQQKTGMSKEVITALYENGFRIKSNDRIVKGEKKADYCLVVARKDQVFLRVYRDGDELDILSMFQRVFQSNRTMAHWKWKFRDNPFGNHNIALAVTKDGFLAAHFCGYAVPLYSSVGGGKEFCLLQVGDTMTHPDFRRMGLGSTSVLTRVTTYFINKFCVDNVPYMYGYNTGHIRKFGERFLGYRYLSPIPYHVSDLNRLDRSPLTFLGKLKKRLSFFTVKRVTRIGADFDRFFKRASKHYGLLLKRDATYLKWRYLDCPDHVHQLFSVKFFGKMVGWCVFTLRKEVLIWGDALFDKEYAWCVGTMFDALLEKYFPHAQRIEGWFSRKPEWWTEVLTGAGFEVTTDPNQLAPGTVFFDTAPSLPFVDRNLYYTMGDSDLF